MSQFKLIIPVKLRLFLLIVTHKKNVYLLTQVTLYILSTVGVIFVGNYLYGTITLVQSTVCHSSD